MTEQLFQPFYDYLEKERQALLTKLDAIERILGISPRTAELRKRYKGDSVIISIGDSGKTNGRPPYSQKG